MLVEAQGRSRRDPVEESEEQEDGRVRGWIYSRREFSHIEGILLYVKRFSIDQRDRKREVTEFVQTCHAFLFLEKNLEVKNRVASGESMIEGKVVVELPVFCDR